LAGNKRQSSGHRSGGLQQHEKMMELRWKVPLFDLRGQLLLPAVKARVPMSRFSPSTHFLTRVKAPAQFLKCICSTRYRRDVCCARNYILLATQKHKKILLLFDNLRKPILKTLPTRALHCGHVIHVMPTI